ncbi:hypothetical protein FOZ61_008439 [Perkinsus olseni]|uniref:Uncharacterized protein n=1 Tax=Perkinsus olseni TaxID=32597 RepID=A0A7J6M6U7_PEROL|nr:hypothetical protein FOZ61_008439 [Perkinsus olseni]
MADSSSSPLPKGSSALNVIQDVAESAPASPSSASSLASPRPQHYDVDIEDVPRSAFGTPSVEPSDLPPLPTRASPSESPAEVRRKRRRGKKPLRDQVRRHQLLRAEPEAFQPSEPGTTGDDRTSRCPEKCSTCAAGLEDLYQTDSEAVMVAVVLSTTVAAAAGAFLSPILVGVAISIGGSAGIFFLVRSPRLKPRPKSSGEFL